MSDYGDDYGDDYDDGYDDDGYDDKGYDDGEYDDEDDYQSEENYKYNKNKESKGYLGRKIKRKIDSGEKLNFDKKWNKEDLKDNKYNRDDDYEEDEEENEDAEEENEYEEEENEEEEENDEDEENDEEEENNEEEENDEEEEDKDSYEFNCETGDIGEKLVYDNLKENVNIKWMNKNGESFKPYDFKFKRGKKVIYVDAKSTVFEKGEDPLPIITEKEQEFIDNLKKNERYYIARVFDARGEKPKIIYYDAQTLEKVSKSTVEKGK